MSTPVLELKNAAIFQRENLILSEVSVTINKGEFVYLIGKTGSGKSSFMKTLYGDLPLQEGEGQIVDMDLKALKEKEIPFLRRKLGVVFQDFKLLNDRTVRDNLQFVLKATGWKDKSEMDNRIDAVLDKVGMKTKGFKFPYQLSGGEQQRVAIARALLNDPELILADEPTGNLDSKTGLEIMALFERLHGTGNTIVLITHEPDVAKYAHRVIHLRDGLVERDVRQSHRSPAMGVPS